MRPRVNGGSGLAVGAASGAAIGGWPGAILGGIVGAAIAQTPMPLDEALRQVAPSYGLTVAFWQRETKSNIVVVVRDSSGGYWTLGSRASHTPEATPDDIDDALYDGFVAACLNWRSQHGSA